MPKNKAEESEDRERPFQDIVYSDKEVHRKLVLQDEGEDRQSGISGIVFAEAADNRADIFRHRILQGNGQIYASWDGKSGHTMENVLYSA